MSEALNPFTRRCTFPYLHGVYLAVNAIPDVHLLLDAPACAHNKAEQVFATHDLMSTLLDAGTRHRVVHTRLHVNNVIDGNRARHLAVLRDLVAADFVKVLFHTAFPMAVVIGTPYDNWYADVEGIERKLLVPVPGQSLHADWLEGYAQALRSLAAAIPLSQARPDPRKVGLVGYFMDRNEEDHLGNVRELRRLLGAMGLEVAAVWLDGTSVDTLARVAEAGTIVSLPHGQDAARVLAERTGAQLVDAEVPFGPDATARFLRTVAAATGRESEAERLVDAESARIAPWLKSIIPKRLVHGRWVFAGDPWLMPGLCEIASLVGARVEMLVAWTLRETPWRAPSAPPVPVWHDIDTGTLADRLLERAADIDLVIGSTELAQGRLLPPLAGFLEFGFPSLVHHALHDAPFLGYSGLLHFTGRVADQFYSQDLDREEGVR